MTALTKPDAIIFDWDGTLADTLALIRNAHDHTRTAMGFPKWTDVEYTANLKFSSRELFPRIYGDDAARAMEILSEYVEKNHLGQLRLMPDAMALLNFLHEQEIPIAVISNKNPQFLEREIAHLGLTDHFFCIFGAGAAAKDKPAGDPIALALTKAEIALKSDRIWFVGDTVTDLLAAAAAGCPAILLTQGRDRMELIDTHKPLLVVENCGALLITLRSLI